MGKRVTIEVDLVLDDDQDPDGWADSLTMFAESLNGCHEAPAKVTGVDHDE